MLRFIKIILNACFLVLAIIGFNAIGGQKYIETAKTNIDNFVQQILTDKARSIGDFSNLHEEFQIDKTVNLMGYKAILAEHKSSGQRMCIIDSGKKPLLSEEDIQSAELETKMQDLTKKIKNHAISFKEIKVTSRGYMNVYGKTVPYAKFEAKSNRFPISDIAGIVASVQTSDGIEKLAISISEKKKYSQLITDEFYKNVKE